MVSGVSVRTGSAVNLGVDANASFDVRIRICRQRELRIITRTQTPKCPVMHVLVRIAKVHATGEIVIRKHVLRGVGDVLGLGTDELPWSDVIIAYEHPQVGRDAWRGSACRGRELTAVGPIGCL